MEAPSLILQFYCVSVCQGEGGGKGEECRDKQVNYNNNAM